MQFVSLGMSDPYCNIWISSNKQKQQNSTMKPRTLNPVWKEIFNLCVFFFVFLFYLVILLSNLHKFQFYI